MKPYSKWLLKTIQYKNIKSVVLGKVKKGKELIIKKNSVAYILVSLVREVEDLSLERQLTEIQDYRKNTILICLDIIRTLVCPENLPTL